MKSTYWLDTRFLAAPLGEFTPTQFRRFWETFTPLPPELKNEKTLYRTNADLFYTVEHQAGWDKSDIEIMVTETAESDHGPFCSYIKLIPASIVDDAPCDFLHRAVRFMEVTQQANDKIPNYYPNDQNLVFKKLLKIYLSGNRQINVPLTLLIHDRNIFIDCQIRASLAQRRLPKTASSRYVLKNGVLCSQ